MVPYIQFHIEVLLHICVPLILLDGSPNFSDLTLIFLTVQRSRPFSHHATLRFPSFFVIGVAISLHSATRQSQVFFRHLFTIPFRLFNHFNRSIRSFFAIRINRLQTDVYSVYLHHTSLVKYSYKERA